MRRSLTYSVIYFHEYNRRKRNRINGNREILLKILREISFRENKKLSDIGIFFRKVAGIRCIFTVLI